MNIDKPFNFERACKLQEKALKNLYEYTLFQNVQANYFDSIIDKEDYDKEVAKFYGSFKLEVTDEDEEDFHYLKRTFPDVPNQDIFIMLKVPTLDMLRRII